MSSENASVARRAVWGALAIIFGWLGLVCGGCAFPDYRFASASSEDCTNGKDDDGDDAVDCADSECTELGYQCVGEIPDGWVGPVAFWSGDVDAEVPDCSDSGGYSVDVYSDLKAELSSAEMTCPACSCSTEATGGSGSLTVRFENQCPGTCIFGDLAACSTPLSPGCQKIPMSRADLAEAYQASAGLAVAMQILSAEVSGGSCLAEDTAAVDPPDSGYLKVGRLCALGSASVGTCESAGVGCVVTPAEPYATGICIYRGGTDELCPEGFSQAKAVHYRSVSDKRTCEACCEPDWNGVEFSAKISEHGTDDQCLISSQLVATYDANGSSCSGSVTFFSAPDVATDDRYYSVQIEPLGVAGCPPSAAGVPTGEVTGVSPITICCRS